jgi:hypothetical protein
MLISLRSWTGEAKCFVEIELRWLFLFWISFGFAGPVSFDLDQSRLQTFDEQTNPSAFAARLLRCRES